MVDDQNEEIAPEPEDTQATDDTANESEPEEEEAEGQDEDSGESEDSESGEDESEPGEDDTEPEAAAPVQESKSDPTQREKLIANAVQSEIARRAEEFQQRFGYKPTDETVYTWELDLKQRAEGYMQRVEAETAAIGNSIPAYASEIQAQKKVSPELAQAAAERYAALLREHGVEARYDPKLDSLLKSAAIGDARIKSKAKAGANLESPSAAQKSQSYTREQMKMIESIERTYNNGKPLPDSERERIAREYTA